jgi:hypothetical protein
MTSTQTSDLPPARDYSQHRSGVWLYILCVFAAATCIQVLIINLPMMLWGHTYEVPFAAQKPLQASLFFGPAFIALLFGARLALRARRASSWFLKGVVLLLMPVLALISTYLGLIALIALWGV